MELHVLQGAGNTGKTTTLNILIEELKKKYLSVVPTVLIQGPGDDQKVIFDNLNGHKVGIETRGDPKSRLPQSLKDFAQKKCDIIFCACRTKGTTVTAIQNFAKTYSCCPPIPTQQIYVPKGTNPTPSNTAITLGMLAAAGL